jgi:hypothetical protein
MDPKRARGRLPKDDNPHGYRPDAQKDRKKQTNSVAFSPQANYTD